MSFRCTRHVHGRLLAPGPDCRLRCGALRVMRTCECCGSRCTGAGCAWWLHGNSPADVDAGEPGSQNAGHVTCDECACECDVTAPQPAPPAEPDAVQLGLFS